MTCTLFCTGCCNPSESSFEELSHCTVFFRSSQSATCSNGCWNSTTQILHFIDLLVRVTGWVEVKVTVTSLEQPAWRCPTCIRKKAVTLSHKPSDLMTTKICNLQRQVFFKCYICLHPGPVCSWMHNQEHLEDVICGLENGCILWGAVYRVVVNDENKKCNPHSFLRCFTCGEKAMLGPLGGHSNFTAWLLLWLVMVKLSGYEQPTWQSPKFSTS